MNLQMGSSLMESIQHNCLSHINELAVIWDYIGFEESDREKRVSEISDEIKMMLVKRIEQENRLRLDIEAEIEAKKRDITHICQTLKINTYFPPRDLSSYSLLKILKAKYDELQQQCNERRNKYVEFYNKIKKLLLMMGMKEDESFGEKFKDKFIIDTEDSNSPVTVKADFIPLETEIQDLSSIYSNLQKKYDELRTKYENILQDICRIAADIEYEGESVFEKEILQEISNRQNAKEADMEDGEKAEEEKEAKDIDNVVNGDIDKSVNSFGQTDRQISEEILKMMQDIRQKLVKRKAMLVSTCEELRSYLLNMWYRLGVEETTRLDFMESHSGYKPFMLEALQEEVAKCQQMKWDQISVYYSGLLDEKQLLENKLLMCDNSNGQDNSQITGQNFEVDNLTEERVGELEHEVEKKREQYERHKDLYDTVATYRGMWLSYMEVEEKMRDPAILANRGGILLKTEKEKKRILKELPKIEATVASAIEQYERKNKARFLVWNHLTFKEYVEHLWTEFRSQKQTSKFKRPASGTQSVTSSPRRLSSATRVKY